MFIILFIFSITTTHASSATDCERLLTSQDDLKTLIRLYDARLEDRKADLADLLRLYRLRLLETRRE